MNESKRGGNPAWKKGVSGNPQGRAKGNTNKVSKEVRAKFLTLIQNNMDNMQEWLDIMSIQDPEKAATFVVKLLPFFLPKLTEDLSENKQAPVFILPAGVDADAINRAAQRLAEQEDDE